ncbi:porin family protein [bacterium]|nr:porin family protein [bacterium]
MKKLLKLLCVIEGITILPFQSFAKTKEKEEDIHYDNYYVDYVYNNYLKNKKKTSYDIETIRTEETVYTVPVSSSTTTTTIINKNIIQNNKINKIGSSTSSSIKQNTNDTGYDFYIGFGVGISDFRDYEVKQPQYSPDKATMRPDRDSNVYVNFGIDNLIKDSMNLEFEIGYVENDKIATPNENGVDLIDYNQKIKTYNIGANLIYDIVDIDSLFIPFIGFGVGMARFELSDFGIVKENDILTNFESKSEKKDTIYGKITAGIMYSMNNSSKFTIGAEYIKYKNIDYKYISLSDLARINVIAGLRFYF